MAEALTVEQVDVALTLTFEELAVLLDVMDIEALAGFDREVLNQATPEQLALIKSTARRGLIARQYISVEDGQLKMEPLVLTMLTACIVPNTTTIMVVNRSDEESELHYLHQAEEVVVAHTPQEEGFHRFIWRRTPDPLIESALIILNLQTAAALSCPAAIVSESVLTKAREIISQGETAVKSVLRQAGMAEETAVALARSLMSANAYTTIAHIKHQQENAQDGWTLLAAENGLWLVQPVAQPQIDEPVQVRPVTKSQVDKAVVDLLT